MAAPHPNPLPVMTGRGDVPCETSAGNGEAAAYPLRPARGEKVAAAG
jgi:hypothetical protein